MLFFLMENPTNMDDLGVALFQETPFWYVEVLCYWAMPNQNRISPYQPKLKMDV